MFIILILCHSAGGIDLRQNLVCFHNSLRRPAWLVPFIFSAIPPARFLWQALQLLTQNLIFCIMFHLSVPLGKYERVFVCYFRNNLTPFLDHLCLQTAHTQQKQKRISSKTSSRLDYCWLECFELQISLCLHNALLFNWVHKSHSLLFKSS